MPDDKPQSWKISATPRQRFAFMMVIMQNPNVPEPKGSLAMRQRRRLRQALGLTQIAEARNYANITASMDPKAHGEMPLVDEAKATDEPSAFTVTAENADELEKILAPPPPPKGDEKEKRGVVPNDHDQVALESILVGLLEREPCSPTIPDWDYNKPDVWTTPKDWRETLRTKKLAHALEDGQTRCPNCGTGLYPVEGKDGTIQSPEEIEAGKKTG